MMDNDDLKKLEALLDKSCDQCLLTRKHCPTCRIDKLRGIFDQFKQPGVHEVFLININDLSIMLSLAEKSTNIGARENAILEKWRRTMEGIKAATAI